MLQAHLLVPVLPQIARLDELTGVTTSTPVWRSLITGAHCWLWWTNRTPNPRLQTQSRPCHRTAPVTMTQQLAFLLLLAAVDANDVAVGCLAPAGSCRRRLGAITGAMRPLWMIDPSKPRRLWLAPAPYP